MTDTDKGGEERRRGHKGSTLEEAAAGLRCGYESNRLAEPQATGEDLPGGVQSAQQLAAMGNVDAAEVNCPMLL